MAKRHSNALLIQSAPNITAIAKELVRAINEVTEENGGSLNTPTDLISGDPAVRLIVEQLMFLSNRQIDYITAYNKCEELK